jgi:hypothetical protein
MQRIVPHLFAHIVEKPHRKFEQRGRLVFGTKELAVTKGAEFFSFGRCAGELVAAQHKREPGCF